MTSFASVFGRAAEAEARAPGRVNLIGEHIDYNGGSVLPTPLPRHARVALAASPGREVRAATMNLDAAEARGEDAGGRSAGAGSRIGVERYKLGEERPVRAWVDYLQGLTLLLRGEGMDVGGFDVLIDSDVPIGGGLSSSAAVLVALLRALRARYGLPLDDVWIALLAQKVENEFVGARVGAMDPMASSLGREGDALLLDTRSLAYRHVPIPGDVELVVIDSGIAHAHAGGEYNRRREECERARAELGVAYLCDLTSDHLDIVLALPEPLGRRARHAITENERVRAAVRAMDGGRPEELGRLLDESHRSLRDDFEVSTDAIETLTGAVRAREGIYGARLTGGGFGGSVLALARPGAGHAAGREAALAYARATGERARVVLPAEVEAWASES